MKNLLPLLVSALLLFTVNNCLHASDNDFGYWGEYVFNWTLDERWLLNSNAQFRFRDDLRDFHNYLLEIGPAVKINPILKLGIKFRFEPKESLTGWNNHYYMLFDPSLKLYSSDRLNIDFRSRYHRHLGNVGNSFVRLRPRLTYYLKILNHQGSWFLDNEFWIQTSEPGSGDRYNQNRFASGYKFSLGKTFDLSIYYLRRSDKIPLLDRWKHIHVMGTALYLNF